MYHFFIFFLLFFFLFFFNVPATSVFYTLSLHDALPILFWFTDSLDQTQLIELVQRCEQLGYSALWYPEALRYESFGLGSFLDRKSTRLNSSHVSISYAVFCLKKKKKKKHNIYTDI